MSEEAPLRHRHRRREGRALRIWRHYRFELIGLIAIALGLFLLFDRKNLRASVAEWLRAFVIRLFGRFQHFDNELAAFFARVSLSDVIAVLLIAGAVVAILLHIRWRLVTSPQLTATVCPRCGASVQRIHRTTPDRIVSVFVPVRRYRCRNSDCGWRGLRVGRHHGPVERGAPSPG